MFTDFLWQLIPQLEVALFQACFPSLTPDTAGEAHNTFDQLSHSISSETQEHVLVAPRLHSLKHTPDTNHTQHPQLQYKLFQASTGKLRLRAVTSRSDREAASDADGWRGAPWVCQHSPF